MSQRIKKRINNLKRRYGMTIQDFKLQVDIQDGKCAICQKKKETLCVDHCHDTGDFRGLLCSSCNAGIGLLGDNVSNIERAYIYLLMAENTKHNDDNKI